MRSKKRIAAVVLVGASGVASAQTAAQRASQRAPQQRQNVPTQPANNSAAERAGVMMRKTNGSLLQAQLASQPDPGQVKPSQVSFLTVPEPEPKLLRRHDLLTIIVREQSEFSSKSTKDTDKQIAFDAKVDSFVQFRSSGPSIVGLAQPTNPTEAKMSGERSFKGDGTLDRTDSLTARITAEVVDVKPNGTIVVQARKRIKTDEEEQQFILTGTCRAEDLTADNTILSTQLYDLELQKNHKGDIRNATKRGLIPKLLDLISPF